MGIFAERLRSLMEQRGIKQITLARAISVPQPHISKYLRGREPRGENILKIAQYFNVSVDYLIGKTATNSAVVEDTVQNHVVSVREQKEIYANRKDMPGKDEKLRQPDVTTALCEIRDAFLILAKRLDEIINFSSKK